MLFNFYGQLMKIYRLIIGRTRTGTNIHTKNIQKDSNLRNLEKKYKYHSQNCLQKNILFRDYAKILGNYEFSE